MKLFGVSSHLIKREASEINDFDPVWNPDPFATQAFGNMFGPAEVSPLGPCGNSHFGYVNPLNVNAVDPGWHVTTDVPGLKLGEPIRTHTYLDDFKW